jgi:hypothetical protein
VFDGHFVCRDVNDLADILEKKVVVIGNVRIEIGFPTSLPQSIGHSSACAPIEAGPYAKRVALVVGRYSTAA